MLIEVSAARRNGDFPLAEINDLAEHGWRILCVNVIGETLVYTLMDMEWQWQRT